MPVFGRVKWFDGKKGFGFIEADDGSGDIFVHYGDIVGEGYRTLHEGERVQFDIEETPKGKKATNVVKL
ncbi:MAG: cold shock domain-containing protein [candidate division WOR-3 bacterium]